MDTWTSLVVTEPLFGTIPRTVTSAVSWFRAITLPVAFMNSSPAHYRTRLPHHPYTPVSVLCLHIIIIYMVYKICHFYLYTGGSSIPRNFYVLSYIVRQEMAISTYCKTVQLNTYYP